MNDVAFGDPRLANLPREPELPWWIRGGAGCIPLSNESLPAEAFFRGWRLNRATGRDACAERVVVILYDQNCSILYEWPVGYMPSLGSIEDVCQNLIKGATYVNR